MLNQQLTGLGRPATMAGMRLRMTGGVLCVLLSMLAWPVDAAEPPALARARTLYNSADYDGAILAATEARRQAPVADTAALVLGRAHLERYRQRADVTDLAAAREALAAVRPVALSARDRVDLLVGLGQSLFLGEAFGAAAELFDTALAQAGLLSPNGRLLLLDWWASAQAREAQTRPLERRGPVYERIAVRMEEELRRDPANAPASYWLAVASRGAGDFDRAWDAAVAGWVRASLSPETSSSVRTDLDRLVMQALIPERARLQAAAGLDQQKIESTLAEEWDLIKQQWR
jgi:hypothetical protein